MSGAIDLSFPFRGRWLVRNSPADRIPSHGTPLFATAHAIDFVPVDAAGRTAPFSFASLTRPEPPEAFPGFGRPVLAPAAGVVLAVTDGAADHAAHRGFPSLRYALMQRRRIGQGWPHLAGNHVLLGVDDPRMGRVVIGLCHLQAGSIAVSAGERLRSGQALARCGNSGNSTEPHLHVQAMDSPDAGRARAVPITFEGTLPRNGEIVGTAPGG